MSEPRKAARRTAEAPNGTTGSGPAEAVSKRYRPDRYPRYGSLSTIARLIAPGETVLDIGCSEGYLAERLSNNRVWGIDGNAEALSRAADTCAEVAHVNLNEPHDRIFDREFDVAVFADVLEHLLEPVDVLRQFGASLRPGGRVIISVPNVAHGRVRLDLLRGRFDYGSYGVLDRTHLHLYTFASARELVTLAGFELQHLVGATQRFGALVRLPALRGLLSLQIVAVGTRA